MFAAFKKSIIIIKLINKFKMKSKNEISFVVVHDHNYVLHYYIKNDKFYIFTRSTRKMYLCKVYCMHFLIYYNACIVASLEFLSFLFRIVVVCQTSIIYIFLPSLAIFMLRALMCLPRIIMQLYNHKNKRRLFL